MAAPPALMTRRDESGRKCVEWRKKGVREETLGNEVPLGRETEEREANGEMI